MLVCTKQLVLENSSGKKLIKLNEDVSFNICWRDTWYDNGYFHHQIVASSVPSCVKKMKLKCATDGNECSLKPETETIFLTMYNTAILTVEYSNPKATPTSTNLLPQHRPLETMATILLQAFATKELSDVIFHTNDSEKVYANRCILHCQSEILKTLFNEKPELPTEIEVNFCKDIVIKAMEFCYGKIDIVEGSEGELINFADKYGIKELKDVCLKSLELRILTSENVCEIVKLAFEHGFELLKEKCIEYLRKNKEQIGAEQISRLPNEILVSTIMSF